MPYSNFSYYQTKRELRTIKRDLEFNNFKKNLGLSDFLFFAEASNVNTWLNAIYIIHKDKIVNNYVRYRKEIFKVSTAMNHLIRANVEIFLVEADGSQKFSSYNDLKEYLLIRKIAGV